MSIPGFSPFPQIPKRSTPEADFDAKMYALFQHFAVTHRNELLAFIEFLETNVTAIEGAINGVSVGLTHPAAGKFTDLEADSIGGAAVMQDPYDVTAGRLMTVPAFGLGMNAGGIETTLLAAALSNGIYRYSGSDPDEPSGHGREGAVIVYRTGGARLRQVAYEGSSEQTTFMRRSDDDGVSWSGWHQVLALDENGNTEQNIGVASQNPRFRIVKADGGFTHEFNGQNSSGAMLLNIDKDANGSGPEFIVQVQGGHIASFRPDEILLNRPIVGTITAKGSGQSKFGYQANAGAAAIEVGADRVADGTAYIDLIGDTVHADYGFRIIRFGGPNAGVQLTHKGTGAVTVQTEQSAPIYLRVDQGGVNRAAVVDPAGTFRPDTDNIQALGTSNARWSQLFAGTGTINTSDARSKQDIQDLDAAERRVAMAAKGLLKKYRMRDAVAEKGDGARWHFGVIAQELAAAFEAEGLDPWRYGVLCWDEWWSAEVEIPAETTPIMEEVEEEVIHMVTVDEPVLDEHGAPTGEVEQVEKEVVELVKKQVETGELEILMEARTELQVFTSAEEAPEGAEYHNRQGVRYDELFAFILAAI